MHPDIYDAAVANALHHGEHHARVAYDLARKVNLLSDTGTAVGDAMASLAAEGYARNAVLAAAYLAAAGFGDDHQLHGLLGLDWLGREEP